MLLWFWLSATSPWLFADRPYRVPVDVSVTIKNSPVSAPFDPGRFDPDSVAVGKGRREVAAQISERVEAGQGGTVSWLAAESGEYFIYYDLPRAKKRPSRDRREPIGGGDGFFHNRPNGFDRLGVGMKNDQPMAVPIFCNAISILPLTASLGEVSTFGGISRVTNSRVLIAIGDSPPMVSGSTIYTAPTS